MHTNHGFTLIEVIFAISIIIVLSAFTLHFTITSSPKPGFEQQCQPIISLLEEAKSQAILKHHQVNVVVTNQQITYQDASSERTVVLNQAYYFNDSYEFHFNQNGNINAGGHFDICDEQICKSIVLNVGSGAFYVK